MTWQDFVAAVLASTTASVIVIYFSHIKYDWKEMPLLYPE